MFYCTTPKLVSQPPLCTKTYKTSNSGVAPEANWVPLSGSCCSKNPALLPTPANPI